MKYKSLKDKVLNILSELYNKDEILFNSAIKDIYTNDNHYINKNPKKILRQPELIQESPYYFETNASSPQKIILVFKFLDYFGFNDKKIVDTIRELSQESNP
jgi:negative regulator of replication initiation